MQLPWHFLSPSLKEEKNPPQKKKKKNVIFQEMEFLAPQKLNKRLIKFSRKKLKNKS